MSHVFFFLLTNIYSSSRRVTHSCVHYFCLLVCIIFVFLCALFLSSCVHYFEINFFYISLPTPYLPKKEKKVTKKIPNKHEDPIWAIFFNVRSYKFNITATAKHLCLILHALLITIKLQRNTLFRPPVLMKNEFLSSCSCKE
jgi:hypothetical protein